jgi:hypothetical protein
MRFNIKDLTGWGIHSDEHVFKYKDVFIHTTKYTDNCGAFYWRFYTSLRGDRKDSGYLWRDKNPRGRKFESRFFTTKEEAMDKAKSEITSE